MTRQEINNKIIDIVLKKFKINKNEIIPCSTLESFGVDSIDLVEVVFEIENDFKIIFPDNIAYRFYSITSIHVSDFIASIANYIDMFFYKKD